MEKLTIRNFKFEGKEFDYSKTIDFRNLTTEKRNLDLIDEFCEYDEDTRFEIYKEEQKVCEFARKDYLSDNVDLTLKQGASICKKLEINEEIMQMQKNEKVDKVQNIVVSRLVKITF